MRNGESNGIIAMLDDAVRQFNVAQKHAGSSVKPLLFTVDERDRNDLRFFLHLFGQPDISNKIPNDKRSAHNSSKCRDANRGM